MGLSVLVGLATSLYMYRQLRVTGVGFSWWNQLDSFTRYLRMIRSEASPKMKMRYKLALGLYVVCVISLLSAFAVSLKLEQR